MAIVAAFLVPGSPLPYVKRDNPSWGSLAEAMEAAGEALAAAKPDTIVVYSTQWIAVLDQLWQTRPHVEGVHVDENWHEYGDLPFDIRIDTELAQAAMDEATARGIRSKGVDYDQFPVDTGTIVGNAFLNPGNERPLVITSNNLYHDWDMTKTIGAAAAAAADELGRNIAVVGIGGLSGSVFRHGIDPEQDRLASEQDDAWNRKILGLMETGDADALEDLAPDYAREARVDMGFKHLAFLLGALSGGFQGALVHGYGPLYGSGGAVVELRL
jgi:2-aminophenol/2-amino-5-chlorophenol 1,6-dioxygenase alpha subunit